MIYWFLSRVIVQNIHHCWCDCWQHHEATMIDLCRSAQRDCQLWHDLLGVINQQLELPKCGYHALEYEFSSTGKPLLFNHPQAEITLIDNMVQPLQINQWMNDRASKYLGHQESLPNRIPQLNALTKKCDGHECLSDPLLPLEQIGSTHLLSGNLSSECGMVLLPCSHFTEKELQKAQTKAHRAFIAKSGYNCNTASAVLFGPQYLGGAGFFHLYNEQDYGQVKLFMKTWQSPDSLQGKLL